MKAIAVKAGTEKPLSVERVNQFAQFWLLSTHEAEELLFDLVHFRQWLRTRALLRNK